MGTVVWDTLPESDPRLSTLGGYEKYARENIPLPISQQHHHHYHYPSGVFHTLGALAEGVTRARNTIEDFAHWSPPADVRETTIAYHIEVEVPGISDKKAVKISLLSGRTLQVEGVAARPHLVRGREGDGELVGKADVVANGDGVAKGVDVNGKDAQDGGLCTKCVDSRDSESEMTIKLIRGERKMGTWRRVFTLPVGCDMDTVKAGLDAGLLHISVFKKEGIVEEEAKMVVVE